MPKFRVVLSETTEYTFELDADTSEHAKAAVEFQAVPVAGAVREEMVDCHIAEVRELFDPERQTIECEFERNEGSYTISCFLRERS